MPSRRDFINAGAAAAAGLTLPKLANALPSLIPERPELPAHVAGRPVIVSSANGMRTKHPDGRPAIKVAYDMIAAGGDPLDAAVAGVQLVELDPTDHSVGRGGYPNEDGVVQLDASCMHGPTKRAGAVAALEDIATPAAVAKAIMDYTNHLLLVGEGAKKFAIQMGFKEDKSLNAESQDAWRRWKSRQNPRDNWLDIPGRGVRPVPNAIRPGNTPPDVDDRLLDIWYDEDGIPHTYGTINMNAVTGSGDIASVTTTSGMSWKIPGRVGDSPIVGAGQYCDNDVGAAGSTGRGESNIKVCGAFLAVEFMRQGKSPADALLEVMRRVIAMTESRLLDSQGRPYFDLKYYAVNKRGEYAGASAYEGGEFAVCDAGGARLEKCVYLFRGAEPTRTASDSAYVKP